MSPAPECMPFCISLRQVSTKKGRQAEEQACRYLLRRAYRILDRNCRLGRGELDIVALDGETLVFVEVKGHQQRESGILAMHADKCQRFVSAAHAWLGSHEAYSHVQCRFDLLLVIQRKPGFLPPVIEHMQDVVRL